MITAMSPSTSGNRAGDGVDAVTVDLRGAGHLDVPARGAGYGMQTVELSSDESENSGAELSTVRKALPASWPAGADGGPTRSPLTKVPAEADTVETSGTRDKSAAYLPISVAVTPLVSGMTTVTAASESWTKSRRNWSPT